jgi:hypothetical protein
MDMLNEALIMTGKNAGQKINIYNMLGLVYDEMGNMDKSVTAFESALGAQFKKCGDAFLLCFVPEQEN